jgi:hypothetical protein
MSGVRPKLLVYQGYHAERLALGDRHDELFPCRHLDRSLEHDVHETGGVTLAENEIARVIADHGSTVPRDLAKVGLFVHNHERRPL